MISRRVLLSRSTMAAVPILTGSSPALAIRDYYDPLSDCFAIEKTNEFNRAFGRGDIDPLWVTEALQLIMGLAYTYDAIRSNRSDLNLMLSSVVTQLDNIRRTLEEVNRGIDRIIDLLLKLPQIVRGEVESAIIRSSLGEADAIVAIIQDKIRPEFINQYVDDIEPLCESLQRTLGRISGLKGVSGVLITSPYLSIWLPAITAVQKVRKQNNPNWKIDSPWSRIFMRQTSSILIDLISQIEIQDSIYEDSVIPRIPNHRRTYKVKDQNLIVARSMDIDVYRIECPFGLSRERLQFNVSGRPSPFWDFRDVDINDSRHATAVAVFQNSLVTRSELVQFYSFAPQLYKKRVELASVFVEPEGIWAAN